MRRSRERTAVPASVHRLSLQTAAQTSARRHAAPLGSLALRLSAMSSSLRWPLHAAAVEPQPLLSRQHLRHRLAARLAARVLNGSITA
jgi:hypothetical protein